MNKNQVKKLSVAETIRRLRSVGCTPKVEFAGDYPFVTVEMAPIRGLPASEIRLQNALACHLIDLENKEECVKLLDSDAETNEPAAIGEYVEKRERELADRGEVSPQVAASIALREAKRQFGEEAFDAWRYQSEEDEPPEEPTTESSSGELEEYVEERTLKLIEDGTPAEKAPDQAWKDARAHFGEERFEELNYRPVAD